MKHACLAPCIFTMPFTNLLALHGINEIDLKENKNNNKLNLSSSRL